MDGRVLALISAFFFGVGPVILSLGFRRASADLAVLISLAMGLPLLLVVSPFLGGLHLTGPSRGTILLFALSGCLGPLLGRTFLYNGINRLGSKPSAEPDDLANGSGTPYQHRGDQEQGAGRVGKAEHRSP